MGIFMLWFKNKGEAAVGNESSVEKQKESVIPPQGETSGQPMQVSVDGSSVKTPTKAEGNEAEKNASAAIEAKAA